MNKFTFNGNISKTTTVQDIMEWNSMEKNLNQISSPITKPKSNESKLLEKQVNITNSVNGKCQTMKDTMIISPPKIHEQCAVTS